MRRRLSDRSLIAMTLLALFLEVLLLLAHLNLLPALFNDGQKDKIKAGYVLKNEKDLKKKVADGLLWDKIEKDDPLYFYDSLLTLSESTASLYLYEKTEINLSENTLVTIEPDSDNPENQIRLKFSRGDFRARNPYAKTQIEAAGTSLLLDVGSEVNLRSQQDGVVEVEVLAGELTLSNGQTVQKNQLIELEASAIKSQKAIEQSLDFTKKPLERIYTHQEKEKIIFSWPSEYAELEYWSHASFEKSRLAQNQELYLPPGKYYYRLRQDDLVSSTYKLEIWQAPIIHLVSPLPRDRSPYNSNFSFIWTVSAAAASYELQVTTEDGTLSNKVTEDNYTSWNFSEDQDCVWQVYGIDQDGYRIPPLYSYPLYIRENPLAAPTIKKPKLRAPASKKKPSAKLQWLWEFFISQAHAAESQAVAQWEAEFSWEAVDKANHYVIEISETPDFRNPLVEQKLKTTEFVWNIKTLKKYYWRVAAGTDRRLGVFSEPTLIDFSNLKNDSTEIDGVQVRKKAESPPEKIDKDKIAKTPPEPSIPDWNRPLHDNNKFYWQTKYLSWQLAADENVQATVDNLSLYNFAVDIERSQSEDSTRLYQLQYSSFQLKAKDPDKIPFQNNLKGMEYSLAYLWGNNKHYWYWGPLLQSEVLVSRASEEEIQFSSMLGLGFKLLFRSPERSHDFILSLGSGYFGLATNHAWHWSLADHWQWGPVLQGHYLMEKQNSNLKLNLGLQLGIDF